MLYFIEKDFIVKDYLNEIVLTHFQIGIDANYLENLDKQNVSIVNFVTNNGSVLFYTQQIQENI